MTYTSDWTRTHVWNEPHWFERMAATFNGRPFGCAACAVVFACSSIRSWQPVTGQHCRSSDSFCLDNIIEIPSSWGQNSSWRTEERGERERGREHWSKPEFDKPSADLDLFFRHRGWSISKIIRKFHFPMNLKRGKSLGTAPAISRRLTLSFSVSSEPKVRINCCRCTTFGTRNVGGGQINEIHNWNHLLQNINILIFFFSMIICYDKRKHFMIKWVLNQAMICWMDQLFTLDFH